ncbi:unnamed protein product [Medioppia subpectinata]|uniref:LsmAD domain-containing protein n=1 Tax=Medioppia subpectinata TaxID=1979941 RepID=A0A7R9KFL1_9ACAR|nr:unnamed protein product [Medioppia subpectinata]CAG2102651.1 unnamed protein product [Medioppia subpectinata]
MVPWDGAGDSGDEFPDLDDHNNGGLSSGGAQNGWAAEDMFRINEDKFQVKSDFDTSLGQYTMALPAVVDKEKEQIAHEIAKSIEGDQSRQARLSKENDGEDDDGKYSDVVRPTPNDNRNPDHRRDNRPNSRKPNSQMANSGYIINSSSGPPGARSGGRSGPSGPPLSTSTTFHGNKNANTGYKYSPNSNMGSGGGPYKSYRDDNYGQSGGYYKNDNPHDERDSPHSNPQPQRPILDGRRQPQMQGKRRDDSDSKYSNDYKSPAPETTHKNSPPPGIRTEPWMYCNEW